MSRDGEHRRRQARAYQELGSRAQARLRLFSGDDRARSDENFVAVLLGNFPDDRHGVGNGHGDFDHGNAASANGFHGAGCFSDARRANNWDDSDFFDPVNYVVDGHR